MTPSIMQGGEVVQEIWKPISGYEGWYEVSNLGNIRSLDREIEQWSRYGHNVIRKIKGHMIAQSDNGYGYAIVKLTKNQNRDCRYVHRLVAEAFIENSGNMPEVNHKDANKKNNVVENLEWVTRLQNMAHAAPRMCHPKWTRPGATGEKYISFKNGRYRFNVWKKIDKTFPTIDEAIKAREVYFGDGQHHAE